jgi:hypothetical protein
MRYREPFTVFERRLSSGKTVFYYRTYDQGGKRTTARSTGQSTRTAAKAHCRELMRRGRLVPSLDLSFEEYATNWWVYDRCRYIQSRLARGGSFSRTHADIQRLNLRKHILPVFGKTKLRQITSRETLDIVVP